MMRTRRNTKYGAEGDFKGEWMELQLYLVQDYFWSHIFGGAAEGPGLAPDLKMWTVRVKNAPSVAVILFLLPSVNFPTDGLRSADEPGLGLLSYVKSIFSPRSKQIKLCNQTRFLHSQ